MSEKPHEDRTLICHKCGTPGIDSELVGHGHVWLCVKCHEDEMSVKALVAEVATSLPSHTSEELSDRNAAEIAAQLCDAVSVPRGLLEEVLEYLREEFDPDCSDSRGMFRTLALMRRLEECA